MFVPALFHKLLVSTILPAKVIASLTLISTKMKEGFILGKGEYAAIPFGKQLMVIHNGEQLKVCRTEQSARNFIQQHKKTQKSLLKTQNIF